MSCHCDGRTLYNKKTKTVKNYDIFLFSSVCITGLMKVTDLKRHLVISYKFFICPSEALWTLPDNFASARQHTYSIVLRCSFVQTPGRYIYYHEDHWICNWIIQFLTKMYKIETLLRLKLVYLKMSLIKFLTWILLINIVRRLFDWFDVLIVCFNGVFTSVAMCCKLFPISGTIKGSCKNIQWHIAMNIQAIR